MKLRKIPPPYSIGLLGSWGTGKSTIKSLYLHALSDDTAKSSGGKKRGERIKALTFNAWRYGGSADGNMKRALLRHVYLELGGSKETLKDELYRQINKDCEVARGWRTTLWDWSCKIFLNLLPTAILFTSFLAVLYFVTRALSIADDWAKVILAAISALFSGWLLKALGATALAPLHTTRIELPRTSAEEYEELLIQQIRDFRQRNWTYQRIVIFVDDLDRLSAHEMVDGLDAIRTFMEIPKEHLPDDLGIVFVISCDENRIAEALNRGRQKNLDMPGAVFTKDDARRYLDRIFQFRLEIPPFPKQDMREFAQRHMRSATPELVNNIESNGCTISHVIDRLIHVEVDNPRNALQLVNAFVQSWWLAKKREFSGPGTQRAGGLSEGIVTHHPVTLAIICALKVNYPRFYQQLLREPELITHFTSYFVQHKTEHDALPPRAQHLLAEFCDGEELKLQYESLKRFIGSLRGHRWPDSLLPFLLLTQDAVSRKFSGRAVHIHDALVSSDVDGYLRELGRDSDTKPISLDDAKLTADIIEDLEGESEIRRNNAVFVIAAVSLRIPDEVQPRLLPPLCRQLELTRDFRSQVGIEKISEVLLKVHPDYQKDIVHLLLEDTCGADGFALSLTTGQPPSLDEACQIMEHVVNLSLNIWEGQGLRNQTHEMLCKWMLRREVRLSDKESTTFEFGRLDEWVRSHKHILLHRLREDYTDQLVGELENNRLKTLDEQSLEFCQEVFDSLQEAGEEDRPILWEQLSRMVSVRAESAVVFAWQYASQHSPNAKPESVKAFLKAFSERLYRDMTVKEWDLEKWDEGIKVLLQIANLRNDALSQDLNKKMAQLSQAYAMDKNTSEYSTQLLDVLIAQASSETKPILTDMISHLLDTLPESGVEWLASHYALKIEEAERKIIKSKLDAYVSNVNQVTKESASLYSRFLIALQPGGWQSIEIQSHIPTAFALMQQNHGSFDPYVKLLFPALLPALTHMKEPGIGQNLTALFQNLQAQPQQLAWLHLQIKDQWPEAYPGLNVNQIADASLAVATAQPQIQHMDMLLISLWNLEEKSLLPRAPYEKKLVMLACSLWPYHQKASSLVLNMATVPPDVASISRLAEGVKPENQEGVNLLQEVWAHITPILGDEDIDQVTRQILAMGAKGTGQHPDLILQQWIDSIPAERAEARVKALLGINGLQDEYLERIWRLLTEKPNTFGVNFFGLMIPHLCARSDLERTHRAVIESSSVLDNSFRSQSEKNVLADGLLLAVIKSSSLEDKRALAQWLSNVGGSGKLVRLRDFEADLDDDTLEVLSEAFPSNRKKIDGLRKLLFPVNRD